MMGWSNVLLNPAVDGATPDCGYVSGWYWDEGMMTEVTSREAVTWDAAADGAAAASNQPVLNVPAATTLQIFCLFPAGTGGEETLTAYCEPDPPIVFTEAGTYTLTAMTLSITNP
jgi:hypothetical protein